MIEKVINGIIVAMQEDLTYEQLQKLENVLVMQLHGLKVEEECTQLVTSERHWEKILRLYIASKKTGKLCRKYTGKLLPMYPHVDAGT